jgi:hypothetical protein
MAVEYSLIPRATVDHATSVDGGSIDIPRRWVSAMMTMVMVNRRRNVDRLREWTIVDHRRYLDREVHLGTAEQWNKGKGQCNKELFHGKLLLG